ncbi:MAG: hypothetical protein CMM60_05145 [Rhodospirillaceae bacterium]|jgi:hypothetical protein|nr:hypothetical protein [Rhodospirillaceae bacterium]
MTDFEFEWDEAKRETNLKKHGIDFLDTQELFEKPYILDYDPNSPPDEDRWRAIGLIGYQVVFCVYTERHNKRRIISVRPANSEETMLYYERFWFESY